MSLKIDSESRVIPPRRSTSLAFRLTAWYSGSSFILLVAVVAFLYWLLGRSLDRVNDNQISDLIHVLQDLLEEKPGDLQAVRNEAEQEFQSREHTKVYVRLLGDNGQVLVETPGMDTLFAPHDFPNPGEERQVSGSRRSPERRPYRIMVTRLSGVMPGGQELVVQAAMDRTSDSELLAEYSRNLWLVVAGGFLICVAVGYQIAHRGLAPVRLVTETAQRIDPSNLAERIRAEGLPAEVLDLANTFNSMLDRLERSFNRLAQFSADIAHELRTPVNNLRGEIEVALGKPRTPEQYHELLVSNLEDCARLARLIDSLLFLARAENPRTQISRDIVELGSELSNVCEFYEVAAGEKGIQLAVAVQGTVRALLNRTLFQRAVCNLVENAIAHTKSGGFVTLATENTETTTVVRVSDNGEGVPSSDLPHLFDRFYRADPARTSFGRHVGLGLAIVKSIVDLHGGDIAIDSVEGKGTQVTLTFSR